MLDQNIIEKKQEHKKVLDLHFDISNSKKYKVKTIWNNAPYANKTEDNLPNLYYLVA